jgi:glutathione S-transferase
MPRPVLYWNKICPFVHRAWIAAIEKNVDIELVHVPLGDDMPEWYTRDVNPAGTVPTLRTEDGKLVFESLYIVRYLDENYGQKGSLQPGDALTKYNARLFLKGASDVIGVLYGVLFAQGEEIATKIEAAKKGLDEWEKAYSATEGPYFHGPNFSWVDIAIVPFLDRFRHTLAAYRGFNIFEGKPHLERLMRAASTRASLSQTMQLPSFYIDAYKGYAQTEAKTAPVKFYWNPVCPFCAIVHIALKLKGVQYEAVEVSLENTPQWYIDTINPTGELPSLEVSPGVIIRESILIAEYVNEGFTGPALTPSDAYRSATELYWINGNVESRGDFYAAKWGEGDKKTQGEIDTIANLAFLEDRFAKNAVGPFFNGANPTIGDIITAPHLSQYRVLYSTFTKATKPFAEAYPKLNAWLDHVQSAEGFAAPLKTFLSA